ncbi:hypothetical protein H6P81_016922 [Aristolochia fimbriata]|uniref:C2 domain-containing protein n=1 Tax=Aristolochia fimbriata TaxID=158543 RepID=A0AAV7DWW3_ARIFI|nr:hypothetical protein H6P81_016922 [Aristolochia fimbriata]
MPEGTLEVLVVGAKGLENTDFLCNMDPYLILTVTSQEQKSSIASGKGSDPEWNETFMFTVSGEATELKIKIMDSDTGTEDDYVGDATIPLGPLFLEGNISPAIYNVVKEEQYRGEIKIGLKFIPEERHDRSFNPAEIENFGDDCPANSGKPSQATGPVILRLSHVVNALMHCNSNRIQMITNTGPATGFHFLEWPQSYPTKRRKNREVP